MRLLALGALALSVLHEPARQSMIVVDGRLDEPQWAGAALHESKSGVQVRSVRDSATLFLGITAPVEGFSSVCLGAAGNVRVLHASAALGAVEYRPSGTSWSTSATGFVYGMRDTSLTDAAAAARRAYLKEHGWVASTARMGGGRTQEFQIDLTRMPKDARLAVAYYGMQGQGSVLSWPDAMHTSDGCAAIELVRGFTPPTLTFDPGRWMAIPQPR
jgi:hypothetical protein